MRGFTVYIWKDLKAIDLRNQLSQIFAEFGQLPNGRLFFYYYGHGYRIDPPSGQGNPSGYLVPVDAPDPINNRPAFLSKAISLGQLKEYAAEANTKHTFFALEACQAGLILYLLGGPSSLDFPKGYIFSPGVQGRVSQVLTAGKVGQDVPAEGVFTDTLIEGLNNEQITIDGYVTGRKLMEYVRTAVPQREANQLPEAGPFQQSDGDFIFGLARVSTSTAASASEPGSGGGPPAYALCRHPDNGIEGWRNTVQWTGDSGWVGGGNNPEIILWRS